MSFTWAPQDDAGRWGRCFVPSSAGVCAGAERHPDVQQVEVQWGLD